MAVLRSAAERRVLIKKVEQRFIRSTDMYARRPTYDKFAAEYCYKLPLMYAAFG